MLKNGYKILLIKEGKYNLKQFNVSFFHVVLIVSLFFILSTSLFFMFSEQLTNWAGYFEIEKHRRNNRILIQNIEDNQKRIDSLVGKLDEIKKQDDVLRKLVKLPPIHDDIRKMGYGGLDDRKNSNEYNYLLPSNKIDLDSLNSTLDRIHRLIKLELLSYNELKNKIEQDKEKILAHPAIYPVLNGTLHLSSYFGYRRDPFSQKFKFHDGHDFSTKIGTDVYSTANGLVVKSKYWGSFGNYIEIEHGNGYVTIYAHLSSRDVQKGDKVYRGQKIGEVGNTGRSTAPHLHYEIKYQSKVIDPSEFYFDISIN